MSQRHLLTVWNPLYTSDVDQHFALLLDWARRARERKADHEDVYVWWGKVKSQNRLQPLPHRADIMQFGETLGPQDRPEVHLYVTDYRTLYVGELLDIQEGALPVDELSHVPPYYAAKKLTCDFWFMVGDFRRLVVDDLPLVAQELQRLHNVHYHDKPVSIYGGVRELPVVVTRDDGAEFFASEEREAVAGDRLWLEHEREHGSGLAAVQADLRDNVLGEKVWNALDWNARTCVASAEKLFREHRADPTFDFSPVLVQLAKALEVQTNATLRAVVGRVPTAARTVNLDGRSVDLASARGLGLGQLVHALASSRELADGIGKVASNSAWFTGQLPAILDGLREVRNPAAHASRVNRETAAHWRDQVIGVGCKGHLAELAAVRGKPR